ncbi:MAG: hypothetical protein ACTSRP_00015 [Candidatus Helarchaeota archaeon]
MYLIELKYKTSKFEIVIENEEYNLKEHRARNEGCYKFLNDMYRKD